MTLDLYLSNSKDEIASIRSDLWHLNVLFIIPNRSLTRNSLIYADTEGVV